MAPHGRQFSIDRLNSTNLLMQFRSRFPLYFLQMGGLRWVGDRFLAGMKTSKRDAMLLWKPQSYVPALRAGVNSDSKAGRGRHTALTSESKSHGCRLKVRIANDSNRGR